MTETDKAERLEFHEPEPLDRALSPLLDGVPFVSHHSREIRRLRRIINSRDESVIQSAWQAFGSDEQTLARRITQIVALQNTWSRCLFLPQDEFRVVIADPTVHLRQVEILVWMAQEIGVQFTPAECNDIENGISFGDIVRRVAGRVRVRQ